jgi:hypothetical protein
VQANMTNRHVCLLFNGWFSRKRKKRRRRRKKGQRQTGEKSQPVTSLRQPANKRLRLYQTENFPFIPPQKMCFHFILRRIKHFTLFEMIKNREITQFFFSFHFSSF